MSGFREKWDDFWDGEGDFGDGGKNHLLRPKSHPHKKRAFLVESSFCLLNYSAVSSVSGAS